MNLTEVRFLTPLDAFLGGCLLIVILALCVNLQLQSVPLVYAVAVIALFLCAFLTLRFRRTAGHFRGLWILVFLSLFLYPFADLFLESSFRLVTYNTADPKLIKTPVYVILYWAFGILLFGHVCHRVKELTQKKWLSGLVTGLFAALSTLLVETLFNEAEFYSNTPSVVMIGKIPVYVPLGYFLVFSFMPFFIQYKYVFGVWLYPLTGLAWIFLYYVFLGTATFST
ncbi:MAG: hypothetical protein PVF22_00105 [Candidatus Aminicenantes bacterium]|jgi:hypothetical protein